MDMVTLLIGFIITIVSLLIGHTLGKNQAVVPTDVKKQINQIFRKVVPNKEVGAVPRPTAQDNYYRDNPAAAREDEIMTGELDKLNTNG